MKPLGWAVIQSHSFPYKRKFGHTKRYQGCAHTEEIPLYDSSSFSIYTVPKLIHWSLTLDLFKCFVLGFLTLTTNAQRILSDPYELVGNF